MKYVVDVIVGDSGDGYVGFISLSESFFTAVADALSALSIKLRGENKSLDDYEHLKINVRKQ